jgi:glycerophosphoryl diester phosphodiesterase
MDAPLLQRLDAGPTPERYAVHAFDHRIIARLGEQRPELRRGILLASYLLDTLAVLQGTGADTLWMETHLIDASLVEELHLGGFQLVAWTANEEPEIRRLARLGVDGICGNYPDRIRLALA